MGAIGLDAKQPRRRPIDRSNDRLVAMASIAIAMAYLGAAVLVIVLPSGARAGIWLPLHLAMAGAASTAIAGVMPFFSAAFAAAPPTDARLRWGSVSLVASGSLAMTAGYVAGAYGLAAAGGLLFIAGILMVAIATVRPLRLGLGPRGGLVTRGYLAALAWVAIGAALAALFLVGWQPVVELWAYLKPAHAWLNLVGFVSLVIATTLLHFFPTVIGARIQRTRAAHLTIFGLALGAPLVALGYALHSDLLARLGATIVLVGAFSLAFYCFTVWRTRARWRTDAAWHGFAMGSLVSAIAWFELGTLLACGRVIVEGADPAGASTDLLLGPMVIGWMGLAVLGSATHLVPAIGPGDPAAHARQRRLLGLGAWPRLAVLDSGIAAVALGLPLGMDLLTGAGLSLVALALASTAVLLIAAVAVGIGNARGAARPTA